MSEDVDMLVYKGYAIERQPSQQSGKFILATVSRAGNRLWTRKFLTMEAALIDAKAIVDRDIKERSKP